MAVKNSSTLPYYVRVQGLLGLDLVTLLGVFYLGFGWKFGLPIPDPNDLKFHWAYLSLLPLRIFLYALFGLYRTDLDETLLDLAYRVFWVCMIISGLEFLILLGVRNYYLPNMGVPGKLVIFLGGCWFIMATAVRCWLGWTRRKLMAKSSGVLFISSGHVEPVLYQEIQEFIDLGHSVIGFVGDNLELPENQYPVLGVLDDLRQMLDAHQPGQVIVVDDRISRNCVARLLGDCEAMGIPVSILPSLYEVMIGRMQISRASGIPLVEVLGRPLSIFQRGLKRLIDLVIATFLFLALFWVWLVIYLLVKIDQEGPALEGLPCVGKQGKRFNLLRFRSTTKTSRPENSPVVRQTPIGYLMSRLDLDRIPQLLNVIKGDLSLVGPRPMTPDFFESIIEEEPLYRHCLSVKPGVTGLAQIHGKRHHMTSKLRYDLSYINNCSILLDLKILFQTFSVLITGRKIKT